MKLTEGLVYCDCIANGARIALFCSSIRRYVCRPMSRLLTREMEIADQLNHEIVILYN